MIRRAKIENYKSLKRAEITFQKLTVVFGPNAAGKSNLFDALNLVSRLVTCKNLKEAFDGHRGLPLEAVNYTSGTFAELLKQGSHRIRFEIDVELTKRVVAEVEHRIRELRKGIDTPSVEGVGEKSRITHTLLRYSVELEINSQSGIMRVMDEKLSALRQDGRTEKATRRPFLERVGSTLHLRMEGQAHPIMHEMGLDYTIASSPLYAPHYPHLTAFREEMARCHFYYFEPRELMREANAIAEVECLGSRGEQLAAFYHTLKQKSLPQFNALKLAARQLLPRLQDIEIQRTERAELFLLIHEDGAAYSNRLISEGTLRVLGMLAALSPSAGSTTVGYEEPENGVHPRRLRLIAELIKNASAGDAQILINTHSPVLPAYFEDSQLLICQREKGNTSFVPFACVDGDLFRGRDIERNLEERIVRGDYGG